MTLSRLVMLAAIMAALGPGCTIDAVQQKQDYVENVEYRLHEASMRIAELEHLHAETLESGGTSNPELQRTLVELGEKQLTAEQKLVAVKEAGIAGWKGFRGPVDEALSDLEQCCELATFMLEEAWQEMQESSTAGAKYRLVRSTPSEAAPVFC